MQLDMLAEPPRSILTNEGEYWRVELGGKGFMARYIEFSVRQTGDGTWQRATRSNWRNSGHGGPFHGSHGSRQLAIDECVRRLIQHCDNTNRNCGEPEALKALAWLGEFSNGNA